MKTVININLCIETSLSVDEVNKAQDMELIIVDALGLKDSPVYSYNIDMDVFETNSSVKDTYLAYIAARIENTSCPVELGLLNGLKEQTLKAV